MLSPCTHYHTILSTVDCVRIEVQEGCTEQKQGVESSPVKSKSECGDVNNEVAAEKAELDKGDSPVDDIKVSDDHLPTKPSDADAPSNEVKQPAAKAKRPNFTAKKVASKPDTSKDGADKQSSGHGDATCNVSKDDEKTSAAAACNDSEVAEDPGKKATAKGGQDVSSGKDDEKEDAEEKAPDVKKASLKKSVPQFKKPAAAKKKLETSDDAPAATGGPPDPSKKARKTKTTSSAPSAKSAYMFFCSDNRAQVKGACSPCCMLHVLFVSGEVNTGSEVNTGRSPCQLESSLGSIRVPVTKSTCCAAAEQPDLSFGELGRVLGQLWKELSDNEKAPYAEQAAEDKKRVAVQKAEMAEKGGVAETKAAIVKAQKPKKLDVAAKLKDIKAKEPKSVEGEQVKGPSVGKKRARAEVEDEQDEEDEADDAKTADIKEARRAAREAEAQEDKAKKAAARKKASANKKVWRHLRALCGCCNKLF
jgi:HMG (high mobility group) box